MASVTAQGGRAYMSILSMGNAGAALALVIEDAEEGNYLAAALGALPFGIQGVKAFKSVKIIKKSKGRIVSEEVITGAQAAERAGAAPRSGKSLLAGEGAVGTYDDLRAAGSPFDNITPHHIPSANHMKQHGVAKGDGISINMEHPHPGSGGRRRQTFTYGTDADVGLSPRDALGLGVRDARRIYQEDGLYDAYIRQRLQELIRQNKQAHPDLFKKPGG